MTEFRFGVVSVVGRPNVGKSTLVNHFVGQKVSIVSDKPQTTRRRVLGIATTTSWQMVFVDTPGVHKPHTRLGKALNDAAQRSLTDVDVVLVVVDSSRPPAEDDETIATMLDSTGLLDPSAKVPILLCLNKMDKLKPANVQPHWEAYTKLFKTERVMLTSFTKQHNLDELRNLLLEALPTGVPHYDDDTITDQSMRDLAAEFIREKALNLTRQEVPHALACWVESWEEDSDANLTRISATLMVEKDGQKAILIGKGGAMLKEIGTAARQDIEATMGGKVFLELFVKVRAGWRDNAGILRELDML